MDFELGGLGKSFKALKVVAVTLLSMLKRDASRVIEDDLEATGLRGIENVLEGRRSSIGSDFALTRAGAGRGRPGTSSAWFFAPSFQNTGRSGNSLPGRYMLSCNGLKLGAFRTGDMRPDCTLLKSEGTPIVGRRDALLLDVKLILLRDLEVVLPVETRWEVKGRGSVDCEKLLPEDDCLLTLYTGGAHDRGCS